MSGMLRHHGEHPACRRGSRLRADAVGGCDPPPGREFTTGARCGRGYRGHGTSRARPMATCSILSVSPSPMKQHTACRRRRSRSLGPSASRSRTRWSSRGSSPWPDRLRADGDAQHDRGARRRAELPGVAGRRPLRLARKHHRPRTWSRRTFWFFGDHLHLHPRRQLDRARSRASARSAGAIRPRTGFTVEQPLFRGANADLNLTLAMALVFFACWIVWALQEVGPGGVRQGAVRAEGRDAPAC